jgi:hypothetical protein
MYSLNLAELQPALAGLLSSCVHTQCYLCFFSCSVLSGSVDVYAQEWDVDWFFAICAMPASCRVCISLLSHVTAAISNHQAVFLCVPL